MDCSFLTEMVGSLPAFGISGLWDLVPEAARAVTPLAQAGAEQAADAAGGGDEGISGKQYLTLAIALAVMILPFPIGTFLAKKLKMPNYGTRFGFVLLAIVASAVVLAIRLPGLGVDLRGGTILVYEIDPSMNITEEGVPAAQITSEDLVEPLTRRINPSGTQEIVIRPYGEEQIEIIVPEVNPREVERIKTLVEEAGILRFAILANQADHQAVIERAIEQAQAEDPGIRTRQVVGSPEDLLYGRWVRVGQETTETDGVRPLRVSVVGTLLRNARTGELVNLPPEVLQSADPQVAAVQWMNQQGIPGLETLVVINPELDVTGEDLEFASSTFDEKGAPAVAFNLTDTGSGRFFALTTNNAPVGTRQRQLGIVLDDVLLSAPSILQPIQQEGRITGNFTAEEVDRLVQILKAGQLPAALTPEPIAENQIGATLGADTIRKGIYAIGTSLILVLIFILIYYRLAGVVACTALVLNLALILATMVLINQPLTLPGLAGLVLTVGMSVDANVLIFERIREELKKGAKPRMAIRNGFAKATVTIVDANLTTLITAIVLYAIGTDQIRGFAVTLILGILFSMFTAIYMSRTFFDLAERRGFLSLSMADTVNAIRGSLAGGGQFDFMSKGKLSLTLSAVLVLIGIGAMFARGGGIFDIDFAGGSSVQFRLDSPTSARQVRRIVDEALNPGENDVVQFTVNAVSIEGMPENTVYKVDSSVSEVDTLKQAIAQRFAQEEEIGLVTYQVQVTPAPKPATTGSYRPATLGNGVMLTAAPAPQQDGEQPPAPDAPAGTQNARAQNARAQAETAPTAEDAEQPAPQSPEQPAEGAGAENPNAPGAAEADTGLAASPTTTVTIELAIEQSDDLARMNAQTLTSALVQAAEALEIPINDRMIVLTPLGEGADEWTADSSLKFSRWRVQLPLDAERAGRVITEFERRLDTDPVWISSSSVGARVAGDMIGRAIGALLGSLLCIIGYIWFRFQRVIYGLAAVVALLHDLLITLGAIAVSYWLADALGWLLIDPFKISLTVVAALLTIVGYSLNDTIVVFDRIRETKGKSPLLTGEMINNSINQTLSRTLLTSLTTLIVVVLLYAFGGAGIHAFAFALVVGVLVGTYSSVFVASPILLWLVERKQRAAA